MPASYASTGRILSDQEEYRRYCLLCAAIIALCLALKLPTFLYPRQEFDEIIYWQLTENWLAHGSYSLRGTAILDHPRIPSSTYDKPLFHHPPLFSILLAPFVASRNPNGAILVSWLGHALAILGVAILCWEWRRRRWHATNFFLWLPVLAVAADPVFTFVSRKLWPDNLIGGFGALGMALCCVAGRRSSVLWTTAAGAAIGLAALTKLPGLLLLPVGIGMVWISCRRRRFRKLGLCLLRPTITLIMILPWLLVFRGHYGTLFPTWIRPDDALIAASAHVAREMSRPWHYYFSQWTLVCPLVLVVFVGVLARLRLLRSPRAALPLFWVALVLAALIYVRSVGHGMQLRYLAPAIPGAYVLLAVCLHDSHPRRSFLGVAALLCVIYGVAVAGYYLYPDNLKYDDIMSMPEILWRMWTQPRLGQVPTS